MARHVDSAVHKFEEWGLPLMKNPETGSYMREGRWQPPKPAPTTKMSMLSSIIVL
jgi:succinate dehydrogenase/fumarate reductase flavoprotein subunit